MIRDSWRIHSVLYSIALPMLALLLVLGAAFVPTAQADAAQQETARQAAQATSTAIALAAPTVAAQQTAAAAATQTSVSADSQATATAYADATARTAATAQSLATAAAVIQATQQAKDIDTRVQISIAATQAAVPSATPVPPTPVVIVLTQQPSVVYVPVPVPAPVGSAPQYVLNAINGSNNAYALAKWSLNPNDLVGHIVGRELSDGQANVRSLIQRRTRVRSTLVSGAVTSWSVVSPTRVIATTSETWRFSNYDADQYTLKNDVGARVYRNIYTIDYTTYYGWVVSLDDVPNPNGDPA